MKTGAVKERNVNVTGGTNVSMDFPMINGNFTVLRNEFGVCADCQFLRELHGG